MDDVLADQRIATSEVHDDSTLLEIVAAAHHGAGRLSTDQAAPESTVAIEEARFVNEPLAADYPTSRR